MSGEVDIIIEQLGDVKPTCTLTNPVEGAVALVRNRDVYSKFEHILYKLNLILPLELKNDIKDSSRVRCYFEDPDWVFTLYHNAVSYKEFRKSDIFGDHCDIGYSVSVGEPGLKVVQSKIDGRRILMYHKGNVCIGNGVSIGPKSVIHRGVIDSTVIENDVVIGALCNIGHNAIIGAKTIVAPGSMIGGSRIGKNCFIGMGSIIKQGIEICDNVMIGAGSVVMKSIDIQGIYFGNPARYAKKWEGDW